MGFLGEKLGFLGLPRVVVEEPHQAKYIGGLVRNERSLVIYRGWPNKKDGSGFGMIEGLGALVVDTGELIIPTDRLKDARELLKWGMFPKKLEPKVRELLKEANQALRG